MKIQEVRDAVRNHKNEELIYIICELYKAIPKAKKEDMNVDEIINNPSKPDKEIASKNKEGRSIVDIHAEINVFASNAKEQLYMMPNRVISKNERPKWRFLVKNLYKEVLLAAENGNNKAACAAALRDLYGVLTYSCHYTIFTSDDAFQSVGVDQDDFFKSILKLYRDSIDIDDFIRIGIKLIIDHDLNRVTLYSQLMNIFLQFCNSPDMKELVISTGKDIYKEVSALPPTKSKVIFSFGIDTNRDYEKEEKLNNITELVVKSYCMLYEFENAIAFYDQHSIEKSMEIKVYVLVRILLPYKNHEIILHVLTRNKSIELRKSLIDLKTYIETNHSLPDRM